LDQNRGRFQWDTSSVDQAQSLYSIEQSIQSLNCDSGKSLWLPKMKFSIRVEAIPKQELKVSPSRVYLDTSNVELWWLGWDQNTLQEQNRCNSLYGQKYVECSQKLSKIVEENKKKSQEFFTSENELQLLHSRIQNEMGLSSLRYEEVMTKKLNQTETLDQFWKVLEASKRIDNDSAKIEILKDYGGRMARRYNNARTEALFGIVGEQELFDSLKGPESEKGGVCRDITVFQAKMADKMGMKNAYAIAYKPIGNQTTHHVTTYFESTTEPGKTYRLNYTELSEADGRTGVAALYQNSRDGKEEDHSAVYLVAAPTGKLVYQALSEDALLRFEGLAGFQKAQELSPGYLPTGTLARAEIDIGKNWSGSLFTGVNSRQERISGVGLFHAPRPEYNDIVQNQFGGTVSIADQNRTDGDILDVSATDQFTLFSKWHALTNSNSQTQAEVRVFTDLFVNALYSSSREGSVNFTGAGLVRAGIEAKLDSKNVNAQLKAEVMNGVGVGDIRSTLPQKVSDLVVPYQGNISSNIQYSINETARVFSESLVMINHWGAQAITQLGYQDTDWRASAGMRVRSDSQAPLFLNVSENSAQFAVERKWNADQLKLGLVGLIPEVGPVRLRLYTDIQLGK